MTLKITEHDYEWSPKYFAVITGLFCGLYMASVATSVKLVDFYGLIVPAGIIIFPLCCILTDILTEVYGFNRARQALWTTLACTVAFTIVTGLAAQLPAAAFWDGQEAFAKTFSTTWRIALAGCVAWVGGEFVNSFVVSKMKIMQNAKAMPVRFIASTMVGQFIDTLLFITIAFYGILDMSAFLTMLVTAWALKVGYEIVALPLSVPITNWVKRLEGIEHFDRQKISVV